MIKATSSPLTETAQITQELMQELGKAKKRLTIGIPKEDLSVEKRLALTPEAVDMIVDAGHCVFVEKNAGSGINYSDAQYAKAGAEIVSAAQVFQSDIVFKIIPPTYAEVSGMQNRSTVCSMLQFSNFSPEAMKAMMAKKMNAVGYEMISLGGKCFPVRCSISEIEGAAAISVASELLSNAHGGKGVLLGGIPGVSPTEVVIIGAGTAGTVAARAALGLGAIVKVFDDDIHKLREIQNTLGRTLFTSVFQPHILLNAFRSADVVIGAMHYIDSSVRYFISEDVIKAMKKGSLIIDLRVNLGGCFETTLPVPGHPPVFEKHGVIHYCVPNLSSRVARTTSMALSNIFTPLIIQMGNSGGVTGMSKLNMDFRSGVYLYSGNPVNTYVAKHFGLPSHDLGLYLMGEQ